MVFISDWNTPMKKILNSARHFSSQQTKIVIKSRGFCEKRTKLHFWSFKSAVKRMRHETKSVSLWLVRINKIIILYTSARIQIKTKYRPQTRLLCMGYGMRNYDIYVIDAADSAVLTFCKSPRFLDNAYRPIRPILPSCVYVWMRV